MEKYLVDKTQRGKSLVEFVASVLAISKKEAKRVIDSKKVFVNEKRVWIASHELRVGDSVSLPQHNKRDTARLTREDILYDDKDIVVLNKPAGLLSNGKGSVEEILQKLLKDRNIRAVHRLDRDTSGCLCFAKNQAAWDLMVARFRSREIRKWYRALVTGSFPDSKRTIATPIDGQEAVSHVERIKGTKEITLLEVEIETGRTHQIRKHLAGIGYPVAGDREYSSKKSNKEVFRDIPRQMLHASRIEFSHPITGQKVRVQAKVPKDFEAI